MKYKLSEIMDIIGGGTPKTSKPEFSGLNINVGDIEFAGHQLWQQSITHIREFV